MATKAGDIYIEVTAEFAKINDQLTKLGNQVKAMAEQSKSHFESFSKATELASEALAAFGVAISVDSFVEFVKGVADAAVQIANMSNELGITTTQYQELMAAAQGANVNQETLRGGFEKMTRTIGEAAAGNKGLQQTFKELDIAYVDAQGNIRPTSDVMRDFSNAMATIPDIATRTRLEVQLMGKGAQTLDPLFRQGAAALDAFGTSAGEDGRIMREETVQAFKELYDAEDRFWTHIQAMAANIIAVIVPALTGLVNAIDRVISAYNRMTAAENQGATSAALANLNQQMNMFEGQAQRIRDQVVKGFLNSNVAAAQLRVLDQEITRVQAKIASFVMTDRETGDRGGVTTPHISVPGSADFTSLDKAAAASAASAVSKTQAEAEKQAQAIAKVVQQLQFENAQIGMSSETQKINAALRQAGVEITSAEGQAIANEVHIGAERTKQLADENKLDQEAAALKQAVLSPQEKYNDLIAEYNQLLATSRINQTQYNTAVAAAAKAVQDADPAYKQAIDEQKQLQDAVVQAGGALLNDLGRAFTDSGTAADRWKNLLSHAIQDVMGAFEGLAKQLLTTGLNSLFGGAGASTLGSVLGFGGSSAILGPLAGSPMVLGGGGGMGVGDWAIVGERGPELVYADTPGNVMSADRTRGIFGSGNGGGGGDMHVNIDARGADMAAVARMEIAIRDLHRNFEQRAVAAVSGQRKRGGTFASTFNR